MANPDVSPIPVHIHGLRNLTALFEGGPAELIVGGTIGGYESEEDTVLLAVEGRDRKTQQRVDIEITVPMSQAAALAERILRRAGMSR